MKELNPLKPFENLSETEREVLVVVIDRWTKGRATYGKPLSIKNYKEPIQALNEAIEEAADLLQYLVAFKLLLLKKGVGKK